MNLNRRSRRPAAAGLVAVVLAIGTVTKLFGIEAGLLAVVLAIVALVVAPHTYLPTSPHDDPDPAPDPAPDRAPDRLPPAERLRPHPVLPPGDAFPSARNDQDPDSDRSTR